MRADARPGTPHLKTPTTMRSAQSCDQKGPTERFRADVDRQLGARDRDAVRPMAPIYLSNRLDRFIKRSLNSRHGAASGCKPMVRKGSSAAFRLRNAP